MCVLAVVARGAGVQAWAWLRRGMLWAVRVGCVGELWLGIRVGGWVGWVACAERFSARGVWCVVRVARCVLRVVAIWRGMVWRGV